ncbi:DUF2306 domain-containing protein [Affinirhizobium pseudoryzae]|uniref:DUF2306 domain-containing protein n=1 Tax=Allorhizobium pseudoryzae TaxID=379684 RepID=UPI001F1F3426|nr:DUF2306 domain-containing protein [Allorhizobium pseudoryzae]
MQLYVIHEGISPLTSNLFSGSKSCRRRGEVSIEASHAMTLEPLLSAPLAVQVHVATVLPAAVIGAFLLLWRRKGSYLHRQLGKLWMALMVTTASSTFFIHSFDLFFGFSPIHILSVLTISNCWAAYRMARSGNIRGHRIAVKQAYVWGILVAGSFTLLPHRIMNRVVFEGSSAADLLLLGAVLVLPWLFFHLQQTKLGAVVHRNRAPSVQDIHDHRSLSQ